MTWQSSNEIGRIIRNAVASNIENWYGDPMKADSMLELVEQLFTLLAARQVEYVLVGGIALLHYVEGRNTEDLDMIMALSSLEKLPEIKIINQDRNFVHGEFHGLRVDILLTENPLFAKVQQQYTLTHHYLGRDIPVASVEGLLLLKLYALPSLYREGNFARVGLFENDVATLLQAYKTDMSLLMNELSPYISDPDRTEIENILSEIQQRIKRFHQT